MTSLERGDVAERLVATRRGKIDVERILLSG